MLSPIHRYVTNRADFNQACLQSTVAFTPVESSEAAKTVRKALYLDDTSTDFYALGVVGALLAAPQLMAVYGHRMIGHPGICTGFGHSGFTPPSGVLLVNNGAGMAQVFRRVAQWPVPLTMTVTRLTDREAEVAFGDTQRAVVNCRLLESTLIIEWPEFSGIAGNLLLDAPSAWHDSCQLVFYVEPLSFPAQAAMTALKRGTAWMDILVPHGLLPIYAGVQNSPNDSLGVVALALALDTLQKI